MKVEKETKNVTLSLSRDEIAERKNLVGPLTFLLMSQSKITGDQAIQKTENAFPEWLLESSFSEYVDKNTPMAMKQSDPFQTASSEGPVALAEHLVDVQTKIVMRFVRYKITEDGTDENDEEQDAQQDEDADQTGIDDSVAQSESVALEESEEETEEVEIFSEEEIEYAEAFQEEIIAELPNMKSLPEQAEWILMGEHINPGNVAFRADAQQFLGQQILSAPLDKAIFQKLSALLAVPVMPRLTPLGQTAQTTTTKSATQGTSQAAAAMLTPAPAFTLQPTFSTPVTQELAQSAMDRVTLDSILAPKPEPVLAAATPQPELKMLFQENLALAEPMHMGHDYDIAPSFAERQLQHANNPFYISNSFAPAPPSFALTGGDFGGAGGSSSSN